LLANSLNVCEYYFAFLACNYIIEGWFFPYLAMPNWWTYVFRVLSFACAVAHFFKKGKKYSFINSCYAKR